MKRLTRAQEIRLTIAKHLFFWLMDGTGGGEKLEDAIWRRIDRELTAAKLDRSALDPSDPDALRNEQTGGNPS